MKRNYEKPEVSVVKEGLLEGVFASYLATMSSTVSGTFDTITEIDDKTDNGKHFGHGSTKPDNHKDHGNHKSEF